MKKICLAIAMGMLMIAAVIPVSGEVVDRIVAIVNDDVITLSELNNAFDPYMKRIEAGVAAGKDRDKVVDEGRTTILNRMIDNKLIEQEAKKSGIVIKEDEVMGVIRDMLKSRKMEMPDLLQALSKDGMTFDGYKQELKEQIQRQQLVRREIRSKLVVTDDEIGDYYRQHRDEYEGKEAIRIKQILLPVPPGTDQAIRERARELAESIIKKIKNGEPFDALVAQFSQGPATAAGGDIGFVEKGHMLPEVEKVALNLEIGDVSPVIESSQGFYIIQVVDKRGAGLKPITEVRQEIQRKLEDEKAAKKFDQWVIDLRSKSLVDIKL
ncbi:MAG: peptidylprolyl isomerase [Syntrophales bacterium]|nr:peptidylprolyl isomerase [Syntrophales bacterium]MCK9391357.1 peptidylprolyl isomerase [Syntrophales bacterium]